ncbi:HAD family hydrolase [Piscinibacter sakaiensis]|uniref:HAD family hydrolase n=1 Tax=Piscinibacter sakaiensis TaxID=1547922 RepID=UPI003AAB5F6A
MPTRKPLIALDADGVLLDFHHGYADAWHRAFGLRPGERDPLAYWPVDRWEVERLQGERLSHFGRHFDLHFWSNLPAIDGAIDACHRLRDAGFDLVCVSALDFEYEKARLGNLRTLGFPIERVVATGHHNGARSPKADAITALAPVAFVDDFLPYFRGMPASIHAALILRAPNGSPNAGDELSLCHSRHQDLAAFATAWLNDECRPRDCEVVQVP